MRKLVLGIIDAGLESKSGGAYNLMEGILKSSGTRSDVVLKVFGTSLDIRQHTYGPNVFVGPLHKGSNLLRQCSRNFRAFPFVGHGISSSRIFSKAELKLASLGSHISYKDVNWWLYPHSFAPIPNLNNLLVICHDLQHHVYPEYFSRIIRRMRNKAELSLSKASRIMCVSNYTRTELLNYHPELESKTFVVYEPYDIDVNHDEVEQELNAVDKLCKTPFFLYPAIDWPHKNHILLMESASILKREIGPEFQIILTGHRRRGTWLKNQIEANGLSGIVEDLGPVSFARLIALYKRARSLVFPSLFEGFGRPLVESMACGTPIIASKSTAIPEIVGNAGLLFDPRSSDEFVHDIKEILFDNELHAVLSSAALNRSRKFTWTQWWDDLLSLTGS